MVLFLVGTAATADAAQGEHVLSLGGGMASHTSTGAGGELAWWYGIDDFWNVKVDLGYAWLPDHELDIRRHVFDVGAGVLYHIDAIQWVPSAYLGLVGLGALIDGASTVDYGFGLGVGGAVDYRPSRGWGVGFFLHWKGPVIGPKVPSQLDIGLRFNIYL